MLVDDLDLDWLAVMQSHSRANRSQWWKSPEGHVYRAMQELHARVYDGWQRHSEVCLAHQVVSNKLIIHTRRPCHRGIG
eukprot:468599-Amphidinium_carterae.1